MLYVALFGVGHVNELVHTCDFYTADPQSQGSIKFILEVYLPVLVTSARSMALIRVQDFWSF